MTAKGLVRREAAGRAHVYEAARSREETQGRLVRHLLDRAFDGSASTLVLRALSEARTDPGELTRIRAMLRQVTRRKP
jgi:predicted transcriptional regulator